MCSQSSTMLCNAILFYVVSSTQEKRAARKELKTLAKKETTNEDEQARRLAEVELREQEELLHSQLSDTSQVCSQIYARD